MQTSLKKPFALAAMASATIMLTACGGGGGDSSAPTASISGKAVDFYLSGATATFLDCGNQTTTTDSNGNFTFPTGCTQSALKVTGGTDIGTNLPFNGVLQAPAQTLTPGVTPVVTPLTTLVAQLGASQAATLASGLGLAGKDLLATDPLTDGALLKAALVVQQVVDQISKTLQGAAASAGGTLDPAVAVAAAAKAVASAVNGASTTPDLSNVTAMAAVIKSAVQNAQPNLPASLQGDTVATNVAALAAPSVSNTVSNVSKSLGTITPGSSASATVAALQQTGALNNVIASASSTLMTKLVSAVTPAALGDSTLTGGLTNLGTAVATGTAAQVQQAAQTLGAAVNSTTINTVVSAVTLNNYLQLGNVSINGGAFAPYSSSVSAAGSLSDVKVVLGAVGSPFGSNPSQVRAGMHYTYNGNSVDLIIDNVALTFNSSGVLTAASVPVGAKYTFRISGSVNAAATMTNANADNLFSSSNSALDLPVTTFLSKLQGAAGLSSSQISALTPAAPNSVPVTFALTASNGQPVVVATGSGQSAASTGAAVVDAGTTKVSGNGVSLTIKLN